MSASMSTEVWITTGGMDAGIMRSARSCLSTAATPKPASSIPPPLPNPVLFVELALAASEKTRWLKTHFSLFFLGEGKKKREDKPNKY